MKANELRIGNCVSLADKGYYQIESGHDIDEISSHEGTNYCEGIPLTEEILLKAGFVEGENKWFVKEYSTGFTATEKHEIFYNVDSRRCGIQDAGDDSTTAFTVNTEHLHQLQNLYHALTGEELEINL